MKKIDILFVALITMSLLVTAYAVGYVDGRASKRNQNPRTRPATIEKIRTVGPPPELANSPQFNSCVHCHKPLEIR